jgi:RNA polymerase sigma-70 factor (ECF subfamily)
MNNRHIIENYYRAHKDELIAFVSLRLHFSNDAEDLVQEVFLRLLSGNRPINETTLPSLAYTFCRNLITDWYRRHITRQDVEHTISRWQSVNAEEQSAESLLSVREINEQLERGLARVPKECRELYRMHIYGAMPIRDICRKTGQPYKAVEYRLGQARKQVRYQLRHII